MLFMFKISLTVEAGNAQARKGFDTLQRVLAEQKAGSDLFCRRFGRQAHGFHAFKSMTDASEISGDRHEAAFF